MWCEFRWNEWNTEHISDHGVSRREAEYVVSHARPPYPQQVGDDKFLVVGRTMDGDYLQVAFVVEAPGQAFVVHARPLRDHEKRRYRRRSR